MKQATRSTMWILLSGLAYVGVASAQPYMAGPESPYGQAGYDPYRAMGPGGYGAPGYGYGPSQGYEPPQGYGYCPPGCVPAPSAVEGRQPPKRMMPRPGAESAPEAPMSRQEYEEIIQNRLKALEEDFAESQKTAEERMQQMQERHEAERKAYEERMEAMRKRQQEMLEQMRKQADEALKRYPEPGKTSSDQAG